MILTIKHSLGCKGGCHLIISPSGRYHYFLKFSDEELKHKGLNIFSKVYSQYIRLKPCLLNLNQALNPVLKPLHRHLLFLCRTLANVKQCFLG